MLDVVQQNRLRKSIGISVSDASVFLLTNIFTYRYYFWILIFVYPNSFKELLQVIGAGFYGRMIAGAGLQCGPVCEQLHPFCVSKAFHCAIYMKTTSDRSSWCDIIWRRGVGDGVREFHGECILQRDHRLHLALPVRFIHVDAAVAVVPTGMDQVRLWSATYRSLSWALASLAVGHWGTCPLDFQHSYFVREQIRKMYKDNAILRNFYQFLALFVIFLPTVFLRE